MSVMRWRRAGLALTVLAGVLTAPAAPAAARSSVAPAAACPSGSDGITVIVDFAGLGGGVQIRCVTEPVSSGFDALRKAGFTVDGTQRFPGLLCRINGKPASDPCVTAPPPDRYWAYWYAEEPGAPWTYSDLGGGNRQPSPGSVEGWAWSDGCTRQPQGAPCPSKPTTTTTRPANPTTTTRSDEGGGGPVGASPGPTASASPTASGSGSPTDAADDTTTLPDDQDGSSATVAGEAPGGTAPSAGAMGDVEVAAPELEDDAGSPAGVLVGGAIVAVLVGAAIVRSRRRAGERGPG